MRVFPRPWPDQRAGGFRRMVLRRRCAKFMIRSANFLATACAPANLNQATPSMAAGEAIMHKINIVEKFTKISECYKPHLAAELNGQMVKLVKFDSPFIWHHHDHEDELFLVVKGRFRMEYRDEEQRDENSPPREEWINEGEFIVVPHGVDHRPVAEQECWVMLFEPASTLNTGNVINERTVAQLQRV
jgi:mannose-6-phosphate isomerase-like protein (cupin superfamily)